MAKRKYHAKARNPFHDHPLMRRGGVHGKSHKATRKSEKQKLRQEWRSQMTLVQCYLATLFKWGRSLRVEHLTVDQKGESSSLFGPASALIV